MREKPIEFSRKLDLALKTATISRGRLATEARVDKSLAGRWARGSVMPSEHNLAKITDILACKFPGLNLAAWDLPFEAFAESIGVPRGDDRAPAPSAESHDDQFLHRARAQSGLDIEKLSRGIVGVYLGFRHGLNMGGQIICDVYAIWCDGDGLQFKQLGLFFGHGGPVLVLRSQIYLMGADLDVVNTIYFAILSGVTEGRALRMQGLMMTVIDNHRDNVPAATTIVMQRVADLPNLNACPDEDILARLIQRVRMVIAYGDFRSLIAAEIVEAITGQVGVRRSGTVLENTLMAAASDLISKSSLDCQINDFDYIESLRRVFIGDDCSLLPFER